MPHFGELDDGTAAAPPAGNPRGAFWDGGGFQILANTSLANVPVYFPTARTINKVTVVTQGGTGSCVIDIWMDTFANYPPTVADTITAAAKPTITSGITYQSSTLTGWTTAIPAGSFLMFHVDSTSVFTYIEINLEFA